MTRHFHLSKASQRIIAFLIIGLITLYCVAILWDFSKYYAFFKANDKLVVKDMDNNGYSYVNEVSSYGDGVVHVKGSTSKNLVVKGGSIVYTAYIQSPEWYYYDVNDQETLDSLIFTNHDNLVKSSVEQEQKVSKKSTASGNASKSAEIFKVTFSDNTSAVVEKDSPIYRVVLEDNGNFIIKLINGKTIKTKKLASIDKSVYKNGKYKIKVHTGYTRVISDTEVNLCTKLPTNNVYFDARTNQLVKNISPKFFWTFVLSAKAYWVLILNMLIIGVSVFEKHKSGDKLLSEWGTKPYIIGFSVLLCASVFILFVMYALTI